MYHRVPSGRESARNGSPRGQVVTNANNGAAVSEQELRRRSFRLPRVTEGAACHPPSLLFGPRETGKITVIDD